jgi:hypothetical protein
MVTPTTSWPASTRRAAATEESTPPDMATRTRSGRFEDRAHPGAPAPAGGTRRDAYSGQVQGARKKVRGDARQPHVQNVRRAAPSGPMHAQPRHAGHEALFQAVPEGGQAGRLQVELVQGEREHFGEGGRGGNVFRARAKAPLLRSSQEQRGDRHLWVAHKHPDPAGSSQLVGRQGQQPRAVRGARYGQGHPSRGLHRVDVNRHAPRFCSPEERVELEDEAGLGVDPLHRDEGRGGIGREGAGQSLRIGSAVGVHREHGHGTPFPRESPGGFAHRRVLEGGKDHGPRRRCPGPTRHGQVVGLRAAPGEDHPACRDPQRLRDPPPRLLEERPRLPALGMG